MIITFDDAHRISNLNAVVWFFFKKENFISNDLRGSFWENGAILKTLARLLGRVESEGVKMSEKIPAFNKLFMTERERYRENKRARYRDRDIFKICFLGF